jgi:anti-sigma factor RsiW
VTLPDLHLSEDALAAYVDGILSHPADERAAKHLRSCAECREAVDAEREAKALIGASPDPQLPAGLLARLLDVPMTADIGSTDQILAIDGEKLGWTTSDAKVMERRVTTAPARPRPAVRPGGAARPASRSARVRRTRRGLAVSLAGLAFGVIASAASAGASSAAPARPGEVPGTQNTRLVVGSTTPMDLTRTFFHRRPAGVSLTPATTTSPAR